MTEKMTEPPAVHVAGSPINGRQHCRRCGRLLIDNSGLDHLIERGRVPIFFEPGGQVQEVSGGLMAGVGDGRPCLGTRGDNPCL